MIANETDYTKDLQGHKTRHSNQQREREREREREEGRDRERMCNVRIAIHITQSM